MTSKSSHVNQKFEVESSFLTLKISPKPMTPSHSYFHYFCSFISPLIYCVSILTGAMLFLLFFLYALKYISIDSHTEILTFNNFPRSHMDTLVICDEFEDRKFLDCPKGYHFLHTHKNKVIQKYKLFK